MSEILIGNPVGWVQARLLGGWRRALTVGALYFVIALAFMLILFRTIPLGPNANAALYTFTQVALIILSILQAALFILVGSGSVSKAVQRDVTTGIIDSHRLTPISGWTAVLGYLTGPSVMILPITAANVLLALGLSLLGGHSPEVWFLGLLISFCVGFTLASLNLLLALSIRKSGNVLGMLIVLCFFSGSVVVVLIPGIGVLSGFFGGVSMVTTLTGGTVTFDRSIVVALAGQAALAGIACMASARKYLRADVPAFSVRLGLVLLAFTSFFAALGVVLFPECKSKMSSWNWLDVPPPAQWTASLCLVALTTFLPIATAAQAEARWVRHHTLSPNTAGRRPIPLILALIGAIAVAATVIVFTLGMDYRGVVEAHTKRPAAMAALLMLAVYVLALIPVSSLLRWVYGFRERAGWIISLWIMLSWIFPVVIDLGRAAYADPDAESQISWLMGCSPPGAWVVIGAFPKVSIVPGLGVLGALAILTAAGLPMLRRRAVRKRPTA